MGPPQCTILLDPEKVQWLVHSPEYYTHFANSHGIRVHIIYHALPQTSNQSPNLSEVTNRDEPRAAVGVDTLTAMSPKDIVLLPYLL